MTNRTSPLQPAHPRDRGKALGTHVKDQSLPKFSSWGRRQAFSREDQLLVGFLSATFCMNIGARLLTHWIGVLKLIDQGLACALREGLDESESLSNMSACSSPEDKRQKTNCVHFRYR
jgi:hypothetical protein